MDELLINGVRLDEIVCIINLTNEDLLMILNTE